MNSLSIINEVKEDRENSSQDLIVDEMDFLKDIVYEDHTTSDWSQRDLQTE